MKEASGLNQPSHLLCLRQDVLLPLCLKHKLTLILTFPVVDDSELGDSVVLPQIDIGAP